MQHARETGVEPVPITRCDDLPQAVAAASAVAQSGDVVLLAPGGTSFDAYVDFAARGQHFRSLWRRCHEREANRNTGSTRATSSSTRSTTTERRPSTASTRTTGARPYKTAATLSTPTASVAAERRTRTAVRSRVTTATGEWDYPLLAIMALILAVGLVMVFSASYPTFGVTNFLKQVAWLALGTVASDRDGSHPV